MTLVGDARQRLSDMQTSGAPVRTSPRKVATVRLLVCLSLSAQAPAAANRTHRFHLAPAEHGASPVEPIIHRAIR